MTPLLSLAFNTFRETIRDRILYVLLVFFMLMIASSLLFGTLSIGQDTKIMLDLGLGAIELFGVAIAIFVGTSMIYKEIDKRTVYVVLTKPVARQVFLFGKFLGLGLTLGALLFLMGLGFCGLALIQHAYSIHLILALCMLGLQLLLLIALTVFFSTFSSPIMSMVFTALLYLIGHNTETLRSLAQKASPAMRYMIEGLYYLLPNLSVFDAKNMAVHGIAVPVTHWYWACGYAVFYILALLLSASAFFERREF